MKFVANNIALIRYKKGLTIRDLAEISGVSIATISSIERKASNPHPQTAHKLCEALDIPFEEAFVVDVTKRKKEA